MIRPEVVAALGRIVLGMIRADPDEAALSADLAAMRGRPLPLSCGEVVPSPEEWRAALRDASARLVRSVIERDPFGRDPRYDRERVRWGAEIAEMNRPAIDAMRRQSEGAT